MSRLAFYANSPNLGILSVQEHSIESMNISIVGTKGAGKGTQVSQVAKDFNLVIFASGDAFRAGVRQHTPLGKVAQKYVDRGELVPDDIVNGLVEEWIWTTTPNQGIIFDGFPRTTFQAVFLESALKCRSRTNPHPDKRTKDSASH